MENKEFEDLSARVANLEKLNKEIISICRGQVEAGKMQHEFFIDLLENNLASFQWQMNASRNLSKCDALDESVRLQFKKFADEAGANYERLEARISQLKNKPPGPIQPPGNGPG